MRTVFFGLSVSVDGFIAPDGMTLEHADDPGDRDLAGLWVRLQRGSSRSTRDVYGSGCGSARVG